MGWPKPKRVSDSKNLIPSVQIRIVIFRISNRPELPIFQALACSLPAMLSKRVKREGGQPMFQDRFDPKSLWARPCPCGGGHRAVDHDQLTTCAVPVGEEDRWNRVVDAALVRAVFPVDRQRRQFLKTVGAATALAAISSVLPLAKAREAFAQGGAPE